MNNLLPQYGHLIPLISSSSWGVSILLHSMHLYNYSLPTLLKDFCDALPTGVSGRYVPPANVVSHFEHFHIPVLILLTDFLPHCGHLCFCFIIFSILETLTLILLPYLGPNLPALLTLLVTVMKITSFQRISHLKGT